MSDNEYVMISKLREEFKRNEEGSLYQLKGVELAKAVAENGATTEGMVKRLFDEPGCSIYNTYRPDYNYCQALDLIRMLWDGRHPKQHNGSWPVVSCVVVELRDSIPQEVSVTVFSPTLADVKMSGTDFCETVCKVYLKVVGWEPAE